MRALALLLAHTCARAGAWGYGACSPGRYGADCGGTCACSHGEECDDGTRGTGACSRTRAALLAERADALRTSPSSGMRRLERRLRWAVDGPPTRLRVDKSGARGARIVRNASVAIAWPQPFATLRPALVHGKRDVLARLGLDDEDVRSDAFAQLFSGCALGAEARPWAHAYGGHQFGQWAGQLGDGRAISLGVVRDERAGAPARARLEVALKGAGTTPFSRRGDGRAALGNLVRELIGDTALVGLGVPCVRSAALLASRDERDAIWRDAWWTGHAARVPAGVLVRVSPSFLRFGSLQLAASTQGAAGAAVLAREALRAIATLEAVDDESTAALPVRSAPAELRERCFFAARARPSCAAALAEGGRDVDALRCLLERVAERTGALVAAWMAVGFAHGVMNTDNLSLIGLTLDMNVYSFADRHDPAWTPNHIDSERRYALGAQREVARWGLERLVDAATGVPPLGSDEGESPKAARPGHAQHERDDITEHAWLEHEAAHAAIGGFDAVFDECYEARALLRLGLAPRARGSVARSAEGEGTVDRAALVRGWTAWLGASGADIHAAARALGDVTLLRGARVPVAPAVEHANHGAQDQGANHGAQDQGDGDEILRVASTAIARASGARASAEDALREWLAQYAAAALVGGADPLAAAEPRNGTAAALEALRVLRVRAAVPQFVARTAALRELSAAVEAGIEFSTDALAHALDTLRAPFPTPERRGDARTDDAAGSTAGHGRMTLEESICAASAARGAKPASVSAAVRASVRDALATVPANDNAQLQTSCGAQ